MVNDQIDIGACVHLCGYAAGSELGRCQGDVCQSREEFDRYFEQLGARYLGKGQVLKVEILDIDLAGRYEPWQPRFYDVRILRGTTPPRIKLRYELRYKGKKVSEGEETISDLNYLMNTPARLSSKRFAYEKHMLRHWFRKRFSS